MEWATLESAVIEGAARIVVDHINYREIVFDGRRYHCAWTSRGEPRWLIVDDTPEGQQS